MIRLIFLLAISLPIAVLSEIKSDKTCPDHYNPKWFEEPSDELISLIEEYFEDKNISFPPKKNELKRIGLKLNTKEREWVAPDSIIRYNEFSFPAKNGIWKQKRISKDILTTHLLIKEHTRISEIDAINVYIGLMGAYWNDYRADGYSMTLMPEDTRIKYKKSYFEFNVKIYGLKNDATNLLRTHTDIIFRDYTPLVEQFINCKEKQ